MHDARARRRPPRIKGLLGPLNRFAMSLESGGAHRPARFSRPRGCLAPRIAGALLCIVGVSVSVAQTSANYALEEHAFNAGGHPATGISPSSVNFRITLDALGDSLADAPIAGDTFRIHGGFTSAYPPPGEVHGLRFEDAQTLSWDSERSIGVYNVYRDWISALSALGYGACSQQDLFDELAIDAEVPSPPGEGFFYLVTAENRLNEEGTKGSSSSDSERPNSSPCP